MHNGQKMCRWQRVLGRAGLFMFVASAFTWGQTGPKPEEPSPPSKPAQAPGERRPAAGQPSTLTKPAAQPAPVSSVTGESAVVPALQGYCVVSYFTKGEAVKGDAAYSSEYHGDTYYFADGEAKKMFDADPPKYLPQFGGLCTTALGGSYGNRRPSDPAVFDVRDGKLYLFSSDRARRAYLPRPDWFIQRAGDLYEKPELDGYDPVAYQQRVRAMKGYKAASHTLRGRVYFFVNDQMRDEFAKDSDRYLPQYDGFCAEGVTRGKRYPADPTVFAVFNQRTFLFFDEDAKLKFILNPPEQIEKADAAWAKSQAEKAAEAKSTEVEAEKEE